MRKDSRLLVRGVLVGLWLLTLSVTLLPVQAQDGGEDSGEEAGDLILSYRAEVVFPAALRFWVVVDAPLDGITGARLTVTQGSGFERTFVIDPAEHVVQDFAQWSELTLEWPLTDLPIPRPFEPITYRWDISVMQIEPEDEAAVESTVEGTPADASGSDASDANSTPKTILSSETGSITLQDDAAGAWASSGESPVTLYWTSKNLAGGLLRDELLRVHRTLTTRTGTESTFAFAIYERSADFCEEVEDEETGDPVLVVIAQQDEKQYPCAPEDYTRIYEDAGITLLQRTITGYNTLQNQIVDTMVAEMYAPYWDGAAIPAWFRHGIATLYHLRADYAALQLVRAAAETDSLFPLSNLETLPPADATYPQQALWQAESYTLALFLADQYGVPALYDLASTGIRAEGDFEAALRTLTEVDANTLWITYVNWLSSSQPDRAIGWTPYQGVTPTPSSTPTATPIPPTRTPTRTPTSTPVPTSTFLGAQVATPVRIRVTITQIARTATNTPLPPGSLPTLAPDDHDTTSGSSTNSQSDNRALIAGLVALAGGGLLLIGLGVLLTLRRKR